MKKAEYVDPIIGSVGDEKSKAKCVHGGGKTHPGACLPGGLVQLSPDTITAGDNGTGYNYCNDTIEGFSFNKMSGIGWYGDLGNLQIMPVVGETDLRSGSNAEVPFEKGVQGWKSHFSHDKEYAMAGYYGVHLDRYSVFAEATVTPHCGMLRFTYPDNCDRRIIFNFSRRIGGHADFQSVDVSGNLVEGVIKCTPKGGGFGRGRGGIKYNLYFSLELSETPTNIKFFSCEEYDKTNACHFEGEDIGMVAFFNADETAPVVIRCGVSYVDLDGARNNLKSECQSFDFDKVKKNAFDIWEKALDIIEVKGDNNTDMTLFYTCMYHVLLDPRTSCDVDGRFVLSDDSVHKSKYLHRTMFSGWDVYRSEFPLLTLINPEMVNDEVNSLLSIALCKNSSLPRWELMGIDSGCMVGDPGILVSADAYLKGIEDFDVYKLYQVCKASLMNEKELFGKPFCSSVPQEYPQLQTDAFKPYSISTTLEYLLCDYAMMKFSKALGKNDDYEFFRKRAFSYSNNYDERIGFLVPREDNGNLILPENEYSENGCVESNIFQQTWFVPYDVVGLCNLMGMERSLDLLEKLFDKSDFSALWNINYNHSNEPCHNLTHYFDILGKPWRTQYWTRRVQKEAYRLGAFGFCGNEDVGQLSAWYVLSALGLAQVCIANDEYYINTPLFEKATVRLDKKYHKCDVSDTFTVVCDKNPNEYPYIRNVYLNGNILGRYYVTYSEITSGGILNFELCESPEIKE